MINCFTTEPQHVLLIRVLLQLVLNQLYDNCGMEFTFKKGRVVLFVIPVLFNACWVIVENYTWRLVKRASHLSCFKSRPLVLQVGVGYDRDLA